MWKFCAGALAVLILASALRAQDEKKEEPQPPPATPAEQVQRLLGEFQQAQSDFVAKYGEAKTEDERSKLVEEYYPRRAEYAEKFLEVAEKNPDDPAAVQALTWVVQNAGYSPAGEKASALLVASVEKNPKDPSALDALVTIVTRTAGPGAEKASKLLVDNYLESEKLGEVCLGLLYSRSPGAASLLRTVLEKSPHKNVQATACFALGRQILGNPDGDRKEAEMLFERIVKEFGDEKVRDRSLSEMAERDLYELRNLQIGMTAPDIEGEDVDGVQFKLSDYRGKVVVLDFWGDW